MLFRVWRFVFMAHVDKQDDDTFPQTKLGISWLFLWFHSTRLYTLKKTIDWGPSGNVYLFFGSKLLTLSVEYWIPKKENNEST